MYGAFLEGAIRKAIKLGQQRADQRVLASRKVIIAEAEQQENNDNNDDPTSAKPISAITEPHDYSSSQTIIVRKCTLSYPMKNQKHPPPKIKIKKAGAQPAV